MIFKRYIAGIFVFFLLIPSPCLFAETTNIATQEEIRPKQPQEALEDKTIIASSSYEYSWVEFANTDRKWTTLRGRVAYPQKGLELPYLEVRRYSRSSEEDYAYDLGGYYKFGEVLAHAEASVGSDVDYIYDFALLGEIEHPVYKTVFLNEKYKFLSYAAGDVHILSPGVIYYFDNHYVYASYNAGITENRGTGHWGIGKLNFKATKNLDFWVGTAIGQRLYDIKEDPDADNQQGYIIFSGVRLNAAKNAHFYINLLYGEEDPDFTQRAIEGGLAIGF
ncbi:MAG: YaiO family outer membrane beta-barrel protein [Candidatus Omnitrophota bacterium]